MLRGAGSPGMGGSGGGLGISGLRLRGPPTWGVPPAKVPRRSHSTRRPRPPQGARAPRAVGARAWRVPRGSGAPCRASGTTSRGRRSRGRRNRHALQRICVVAGTLHVEGARHSGRGGARATPRAGRSASLWAAGTNNPVPIATRVAPSRHRPGPAVAPGGPDTAPRADPGATWQPPPRAHRVAARPRGSSVPSRRQRTDEQHAARSADHLAGCCPLPPSRAVRDASDQLPVSIAGSMCHRRPCCVVCLRP